MSDAIPSTTPSAAAASGATVAPEKAATVRKSHYDTLDIPSTATAEQIEEAYNALVIEYSPKVSEGDAAAADAFEKINAAYQLLSDPTKKTEYDAQLAAAAADESSGRKSLFGKAFGALLARLPTVTPAVVPAAPAGFPPAVLETANEILTSGGFEGGGPPLDARVSDLTWGGMTESRVERGAATFFRLTVDNPHAENGFVVLCRSAAKGRFKIAMLAAPSSSSGGVSGSSDATSATACEILYQEDAVRARNKSYTQAVLYFTSFDTYQFAPITTTTAATTATATPAAETADKSLPPFFTKLDNFTSCKKNITPGQYLVCVYGDNFIGRTVFSIMAAPAKNDAPAVTEIEETDEALVECKNSLQAMKSEYALAKAAYEALVKKVKEEEEKMNNLLLGREKSYQSFLDASTEAFLPPETTASTAAPAGSGSKEGTETDARAPAATTDDAATADSAAAVGGIGAYGASLASSGYSVASSAATVGSTAATAAARRASESAGWLVGRVSTFLKRDEKPEEAPADGAGVTDLEAAVVDGSASSVAATTAADVAQPPVATETNSAPVAAPAASAATTSDAEPTTTDVTADPVDASAAVEAAPDASST